MGIDEKHTQLKGPSEALVKQTCVTKRLTKEILNNEIRKDTCITKRESMTVTIGEEAHLTVQCIGT